MSKVPPKITKGSGQTEASSCRLGIGWSVNPPPRLTFPPPPSLLCLLTVSLRLPSSPPFTLPPPSYFLLPPPFRLMQFLAPFFPLSHLPPLKHSVPLPFPCCLSSSSLSSPVKHQILFILNIFQPRPIAPSLSRILLSRAGPGRGTQHPQQGDLHLQGLLSLPSPSPSPLSSPSSRPPSHSSFLFLRQIFSCVTTLSTLKPLLFPQACCGVAASFKWCLTGTPMQVSPHLSPLPRPELFPLCPVVFQRLAELSIIRLSRHHEFLLPLCLSPPPLQLLE